MPPTSTQPVIQSRNAALKSGLIRVGFGAAGIKMLSLVLTLCVSIFLARVLGADGLGRYTLVMSIIGLMGVPALMGMPSLVLRETAQAHSVSDWPLMRGIWSWAVRRIVLIASVLLLGALGLVFGAPALLPEDVGPILLLGLPLVPLIALSAVRAAALQGLGHILWSQALDALLRPVLLMSIGLATYFALGQRLSPEAMILVYLSAVLICFILGGFLLWRKCPAAARSLSDHTTRNREWGSAVWSLALIAAAQSVMTNADFLMLGWWETASTVGHYKVATSGAALAAVGLGVVAGVVNPRFAALYRTNSMTGLSRLAPRAAAVAFGLALPLVVLFALWGQPVLSLIYGPAYGAGVAPLSILAFSQLISAFFGSCIGLLNMTGHEKRTMRGFLLATGTNVALNAALIPHFGMTGAAWATLISTTLWNLYLWAAALRLLSVDSSVLGLLRGRQA